MPSMIAKYGDENLGGYSRNLWRNCPISDLLLDNNIGSFVYDNFTDFCATTAVKYETRAADSTVTLGGLNSVTHGVVRLGVDATDNNEVNIAGGSGTCGFCTIDAGAGQVWFETRFRVSAVADNTCGILIGLGEVGAAGADLQADDTSAYDKDFVGFRTLQADGDGLDAVFKTASVTEVVVKEVAHTLVANTWVRAGFHFDGKKVITYYVDGLPVGTCNESDTGFPDGEILHFLAGAKVGSGNALNLDIDWYQAAVLRV